MVRNLLVGLAVIAGFAAVGCGKKEDDTIPPPPSNVKTMTGPAGASQAPTEKAPVTPTAQ